MDAFSLWLSDCHPYEVQEKGCHTHQWEALDSFVALNPRLSVFRENPISWAGNPRKREEDSSWLAFCCSRDQKQFSETDPLSGLFQIPLTPPNIHGEPGHFSLLLAPPYPNPNLVLCINPVALHLTWDHIFCLLATQTAISQRSVPGLY